MSMPLAPQTWLETVAATARARLDALIVDLHQRDLALASLAGAADWRSPAADGFHGHLEQLRAQTERTRNQCLLLEDAVRRLQRRLAAGEWGMWP